MVGCGNFCEHDSGSQRTDLFASGAGAESIRMMIRKCSMEHSWHLVSVDVKTAFLQAPLMDMKKDGKLKVTVVRVPSILREAGVTTAKYWKVKKALYGLSSAPRSWSIHRDRVMTDLRIDHGDEILRLRKLKEDANLWQVLKYPRAGAELATAAEKSELKNGEYVGVIALYVDDILIASTKEIGQSVVRGLETQWELSHPEWLSKEGDSLKFAGFELEQTACGIRLHQESYTRDLLEQYQELIPGVERADVPVAMPVSPVETPVSCNKEDKIALSSASETAATACAPDPSPAPPPVLIHTDFRCPVCEFQAEHTTALRYHMSVKHQCQVRRSSDLNSTLWQACRPVDIAGAPSLESHSSVTTSLHRYAQSYMELRPREGTTGNSPHYRSVRAWRARH
eukprot:s8725_g2.t1